MEHLRSLAQIKKRRMELVERDIQLGVNLARLRGLGWRQIASALGMAHSNAYDRYHEQEEAG